MTKTLRHKDILQKDEFVHFARTALSATRPKTLHTHDFFEIFWVQNGNVRHHTPDGPSTLNEGDLALLSPGQVHGVQGKGEHSLVVSLCFHPAVIEGLLHRLGDVWPATTGFVIAPRDIRQLAALNQAALQLERGERDRIAAEAFLLPLLSDLRRIDAPNDVPDWLTKALEDARHPDVFRAGAAGLVARTGRAHPHVSRTVRRFFGESPSDLINEIRMAYAARQLVTDNENIRAIATDCGIPNMAHFHKLFRTHHGVTPLRYRQKFQSDIIQP